MNMLRRIFLAAAALLPISACANVLDIPYWNIGIKEKQRRPVADVALRYDWGRLARVNRLGSGNGAGVSMGTDEPMPDEPLNVHWTDKQGKRHSVSVPVKRLIGDPTSIMTRGGVLAEISDASFRVVVTRSHRSTRNGRPWVDFVDEVIFTYN